MKNKIALSIFGLFLASSGAVFAQGGDSGTIVGNVFDQGGNPVKGVKIVAKSDTQIGGSKTTYSNDEGYFRIGQLAPGTFELTATAPGLAPFVQKNLKVGITAATEVSPLMEVKTSEEQVVVVEKAPTISTTKATVKEVFDVDWVDSMPHSSRDGIMFNMVAATAGATGSGAGMRGGGSGQTTITMDGFTMINQSPTLKSAAAFEIQGAGYGADNPTAAGGLVNLVSRSGSNRFEFELGGNAQNRSMEFFRDGTDSRNGSSLYVLNPTFAGPIIKDRLWFAVNLEGLYQVTGRDKDPQGTLPDPIDQTKPWYKGLIKLTWQVTPRNKLTSVNSFDETRIYNTNGNLGVAKEAQSDRFNRLYFFGLIWESVLTDRLVFRSQIGTNRVPGHEFPSLCRTNPNCLFVLPQSNTFPRTVYFGNTPTGDIINASDSVEMINKLEWFLETKSYGEHNLRISNTYRIEHAITATGRPGDGFEEFNGAVPLQFTTYYSNDPRYEAGRYGFNFISSTAKRNVSTLSDAWRATRFLTLTPAISFLTGRGENQRGDVGVNTSSWSPGITAAWDPTHDGRTVIRSSFSSYVDLNVLSLAQHSSGSPASKRCQWNPATLSYDLGCTFSGGLSSNTFGLPCGPTGVDITGNPCREALKSPRTWEYTLGTEREIADGLALGSDIIYRRFTNQYDVSETNRIWNTSGSELDRTGGFRNGRAQTILNQASPDAAIKTYTGVTTALTQREGKVKIRLSYTWSKLYDTTSALNDVPGRDVYIYGPGNFDNRHQIKATMNYQATQWMLLGVKYGYNSGRPYSRLFRNIETGSFEDYRARRGTNPGANINDPADDRELRLPDIQDLGVQVRFNLRPLIGQRVEFYVDILNVLALRTTNAVEQNDVPSFGQTTGRLDPFRGRVGFNLKY